MKKTITFTLGILTIALFSSCKEKMPTFFDFPHSTFLVTNTSEHNLTIIKKLHPQKISDFYPGLELQNGESFSWTTIYPHAPIIIYYSKGDRMEYHFDDEYKVIFMADYKHDYNMANFFVYDYDYDEKVYFFNITEEIYDYAVMLNEQGLIFAGSEEPGWELPPQYEDEK